MKELIIIALIVASVQCSAIKSEQSHHHGKEKDGHHHMGFVVSPNKISKAK